MLGLVQELEKLKEEIQQELRRMGLYLLGQDSLEGYEAEGEGGLIMGPPAPSCQYDGAAG